MIQRREHHMLQWISLLSQKVCYFAPGSAVMWRIFDFGRTGV
jgi:hypothetical protein